MSSREIRGLNRANRGLTEANKAQRDELIKSEEEIKRLKNELGQKHLELNRLNESIRQEEKEDEGSDDLTNIVLEELKNNRTKLKADVSKVTEYLSASQQRHNELKQKFLDLISSIQGFGDQQQREFNRTNDAIRGANDELRGLRSDVQEGSQRLQEVIKESIQTFGIQARLLMNRQSYLLQDQNCVPEVDKNGVRWGGNGAIVQLILSGEIRVGDVIFGTSIESRTLGNHLNRFRLVGLKLAEDPAGQIYLVVIQRLVVRKNGTSRTRQIHSGYDPLGNPIQTLYFKKHQVPASNKKLWENHNDALTQMLDSAIDLSDVFRSGQESSSPSASHASHASRRLLQRKRPRIQGIQSTSARQSSSSAARQSSSSAARQSSSSAALFDPCDSSDSSDSSDAPFDLGLD